MCLIPFFIVPVFGYSVEYEILGKTIFHTPTVCTIPPDAENLLKTEKEMLLYEAKTSVGEWKAHLRPQYKYDIEKWNINYKVLTDSNTDIDKSCDIIIQFQAITT